jgi:pimeloyl-ACP methyl ester carboxylesterase
VQRNYAVFQRRTADEVHDGNVSNDNKKEKKKLFFTCLFFGRYDAKVMEEHFLLMGDFDHVGTASKISCPCLVITGGADELMPKKWVKDLSLHIKNSVYAEVAGAGHAAGIFFAEEFAAQIVDFVKMLKK